MKNKTTLLLLLVAVVLGFVKAGSLAHHALLGQFLGSAANHDDRDDVVSLLNQGADVNAEDPKLEDTPLEDACDARDLTLVKLLVEHGAEINHHDWRGVTPLMAATWNNSPACVAFLLNHGADVNAVSRDGTALFIAAKQGRDAILPLLLQHGANPSVSFHGETAVQVATDAEDYTMANELKKAGAK